MRRSEDEVGHAPEEAGSGGDSDHEMDPGREDLPSQANVHGTKADLAAQLHLQLAAGATAMATAATLATALDVERARALDRCVVAQSIILDCMFKGSLL